MIVLCDTCSVWMVWRIAPEMFIDARFECVVTKEVHDELFRIQKFKELYPWRAGFKKRIKVYYCKNFETNKKVDQYYDQITKMVNLGVINEKTGTCFDLSRVDRRIISCALANEFQISTAEKAMVQYIKQEYPSTSKGFRSPLELVNLWLEHGLIEWNEERQEIMAEWKEDNSRSQLGYAKKKFKELTGYVYVGS